MATKGTTTKKAVVKKEEKKEEVVETNVINNENKADAGNAEMEALLALVKQMKEELDTLKQKETQPVIVESKVDSIKEDTTTKLLEALVNNKSNREVTIIHNEEMFNGLCTAIELSNLSIKFTRLGEQRVLSWQQFEELVSKYRGFIDRGLVKVSANDRDLCDKYQIQCYEPTEGYTITAEILNKLPDMTDDELKRVYNGLSEDNQKILLNYWLGKCYAREEERDARFYNRYKIDLLNSLSGSYLFDNIIADMNSAYVRRD
jgi:hypothetical protein